MKKTILSLFLLLVLLAAAPFAHADVIWEPYTDKFYPSHADQCTYINRYFDAPAEVTGYESPENTTAKRTFSAGSTLFISHSYTDGAGTVWGVWEEGGESCWVKLEDLKNVYDSRDFMDEHRAQIAPYNGEMAGYAIENVLYLWSYPGSGVIDAKLSSGEAITEDAFSSVYTAPDGARWAYIPYLYAMSGWVYVDDPENASLEPAATAAPSPSPSLSPSQAATNAPTPEATAAPVSAPVPAKKDLTMLYWAVGAVVLVMAASAVLIARFYRKAKK